MSVDIKNTEALVAQVVDPKKRRTTDTVSNETKKKQKVSQSDNKDEVIFQESKSAEDIQSEKFASADICDVSDDNMSPAKVVIKHEKKSPEKNVDSIIKSGVLVYKDSNGEHTDTYIGQFNSILKPHGFGRHFRHHGGMHVGQYKNGLKNGHGVFRGMFKDMMHKIPDTKPTVMSVFDCQLNDSTYFKQL
jgi:hypothetical protein